MGYIIVWRHNHREPFIETNDRDFMEDYSTYEQAKEAADETVANEGPQSKWYFDYAIYEEVTS